MSGSAFVPSPQAAESSRSPRPKIYDESADGSKQVAEGITLAEQNKKHVLVQFGANWCVPCIKLHTFFETNKPVHDALKADYVVVHIDSNKRNRHLSTNYHAAIGYGLPFLVVLDSNGKHLFTKNTDEFLEGRHYNPEKVLTFLGEWTPKAFAARQTALERKPISQWVRELVEKPLNTDTSVEFERIRRRPDEAVPALIDVITSGADATGAKDDQRKQAYNTLGQLGVLAKAAAPVLTDQFTTNNHLVHFAASALSKLGPDARTAIPTLRRILSDPELNRVLDEPDERSDARSWLLFNTAQCLARIDPDQPKLTPIMLRWITSTNVFCRRTAPRVLGELGPAAKSATPALITACRDDDETVRQHATNALAIINTAKPNP